jgi:hypothetical protein
MKTTVHFWISILGLVFLSACTNEPDETPPILVVVSSTTCAEGDTLTVNVTQGNTQLTGVSWNVPYIHATATGYQLIAPSILSDTSTTSIIASYQNQSSNIKLVVYKRAFRKPRVSYTNFIVPLFEQNCNFSGCHGNGSRAGKVSLSAYDSTSKFVQPYNASGSLVLVAILREDPLRWMPPAGKLHPDKIEKIRLWIEQGALNN